MSQENCSLEICVVKLRFLLISKSMLKKFQKPVVSEHKIKGEKMASENADYSAPDFISLAMIEKRLENRFKKEIYMFFKNIILCKI